MRLMYILSILFVFYSANATEFMPHPTEGAFASTESPSLVRVTNLASDGHGTLSDAIKKKGPRVIVFDVSGVIDLRGKTLRIMEPYVTIAGQTAPGNVVIIRGGIEIKTHDVHLSHLAIRPGDLSRPKHSGGEMDAVSIIGPKAHFILLEYLSLSWGTDENLSVSGPRDAGHAATAGDVWVRHCLIAEGLHNANHIQGKHSNGALIHDFVQRVAFVGNIFVSNARRNPYFKAHTNGYIVNNWIVNPRSAAIELGFVDVEWLHKKYEPKPPEVTVINNILTTGSDSSANLAFISNQGLVYLKDNVIDTGHRFSTQNSSGNIQLLATPPLQSKDWSLIKTSNLAEYLMNYAGSRPISRDEVDKRILRQIKLGQSHIIDSQLDVGGYPAIQELRHRVIPPESSKSWPEWLAILSNQLVFPKK